MSSEIQSHSEGRPGHSIINVHVRYLAARRPFEDPRASAVETLAELKPRVLEFFKLEEGTAEGGTKTYEFAIDGTVLGDLSVELGKLAKGQHNLKLDLVERFEQG